MLEEMRAAGFGVVDLGTDSPQSVDYPDYANILAKCLAAGEADLGVAICGTGIGISMAANRHPHIRCALIHDETGARLTRLHNDANVIAFGARVIGIEVARAALTTFVATPFEGGRHARRVEKLQQIG
ncbi:MAG: ribose 5-phosphate isomerase B [Alphaproteobacteria bacterium]|nr:ribose 5-phosphate isomerase B [Alphaproteobacteria bacterium]